MPCTKHHGDPPPPLRPPCLAILYFIWNIEKERSLIEFPSPTFGGVCKGHIKNCREMMFPESKKVFKKKRHFMQKNRKMAGKVCDVIGHMLNFPFFAKLDITNIIILLFSLSIFLISLTPPPPSLSMPRFAISAASKNRGRINLSRVYDVFTNKKSVQPEDVDIVE